MVKPTYKSFLLVALPLATLGYLTSSGIARGQITADKTLGTDNSVVTPNQVIRGIPSDRIDGGAIRGNNLFHSFREFNINQGRGAYFSNPGGIENIINRVTGSNASNINGTLGVLGNANLFFANPNGIIFGQNARLDVAGSFFATTADSFVFDNGFEFSASNPQALPLLTVNIPIGLRFREGQSGDISNAGNLAVTTKQNLTLSAKNITSTASLTAPGGKLTLTAEDNISTQSLDSSDFLGNRGSITLTAGDNITTKFLDSSSVGDAGEIILTAGGNITTQSLDTSSLLSNGGLITLTAGGNITAQSLDTSSFSFFGDDPKNAGVSTLIRAGGDVSFDSYEGASLHILAGGNVKILGNVNIKSEDATNGLVETVTLSNGTTLAINGQTEPTLDIRAGTTAFATQGISPTNAPKTSADITIGSINNEGGTVFLTNQYQSNPNLVPGNIQILGLLKNERNTTFIRNPTWIVFDATGDITTSQINTSSAFDPTNIQILSTGGDINTTAGKIRNGLGIITLKAAGDIFTGDVERFLTINLISTGGNINTTAGEISNGSNGIITLKAAGYIFTGDVGIGGPLGGTINLISTGGDINTTAGFLGGFSISLDAKGNIATGNISTAYRVGGEVNIISREGNIDTSGGRISTNGFGAGDVNLRAAGDIVTGDISTSATYPFASCKSCDRNDDTTFLSGNINIEGRSLTLFKGTKLRVFTDGPAKAGNINIQTSEFVNIPGGIGKGDNVFSLDDRPGGIYSAALQLFDKTAVGDAGSINIETGTLRISNGGVINALAETPLSNSGNIQITAKTVELTDGGQILTTTSGSGLAGNIIINNAELVSLKDPNTGLFANTNAGSSGKGGSIFVDSKLVDIQDAAKIAVDSNGTGEAGNITLQTNIINLNNKAAITAETSTVNGGNITLNIRERLLMRRNSLLSTNAGGEGVGGNGGNININAPDGFLISFPKGNSDITANAFSGDGGKVNINAQGIFGFVPRSRADLVELLGTNDSNQLDPRRLSTNDITAISQNNPSVTNQGQVNIDTIQEFQPTEAPEITVIDPREQIAQNPCTQGVGSEFVVLGRGGLPPNPTQNTRSPSVRVSLVKPVTRESRANSNKKRIISRSKGKQTTLNSPVTEKIVPAQGWIFNDKGQVVLTAYNPTDRVALRSQSKPGICSGL